MAIETVEKRLTELEKRLRRIEGRFEASGEAEQPWWRKVAGRFKDNPEFDEAMRLGREYRESLPTDKTEDA